MKHRDHFSHSVYVFALGLAIYETNESMCREAIPLACRFRQREVLPEGT